MSLDIVCRIPESVGNVIRTSWNDSFTVERMTPCYSCSCDDCEIPVLATTIVRGETDSFGWEEMYYCDKCLKEAEANHDAYENATDVEDRQGWFLISECTNYAGHGDWFKVTTSFREATAFYRQIERRAAPWQGLYPNKGIREITKEEAERRKEAHRKALKEEMEWEAEQDAEYERSRSCGGY